MSSERGSKLYVSRATVDTTYGFVPEQGLPGKIQELPVEKFQAKTPEEFKDIEDELTDRGIRFVSTVGGNGVNMLHRNLAVNKHRQEPELLIARTWVGSDNFRALLEEDLGQPGVEKKITEYDGDTPRSIIIPRMTKKKGKEEKDVLDRTIVSNQPTGLESEFASHIPDNATYAVINSLGGDDWHTSLTDGVRLLKQKDIPYAYTPGSPQLKTIADGTDREKIDAAYEAIAGARTLNIDLGELKKLIKGKDKAIEVDDLPITTLLDHGLDMGQDDKFTLFVTDGADGSFAATKDKDQRTQKVWVSSMPVKEVVSTAGAGDAYASIAIDHYMRTGDMVESARRGSASGAFAVEYLGAHENPATNEQIDTRLRQTPPEMLELQGAREQLIYSAH
jgi:hypothetical protein